MTSTTLVTFLVRVPPEVEAVELLGSWDNFKKPYNMQRDVRIGAGHWRGCHFFTDIVYDGETNIEASRRDGGLKMGATYWYHYRLNHEEHYYNEALPSTKGCPLLPDRVVNVLNVPVSLPTPSSKCRNSLGRSDTVCKVRSIEYDAGIDDEKQMDEQEDSLSSDFASVLNITAVPRPHSAPAVLPSSLDPLHEAKVSRHSASSRPSIESSSPSYQQPESFVFSTWLDDIDRPRGSDFRAKTSVATNRILTKISTPFANLSGIADTRRYDDSGNPLSERHRLFDKRRHRVRPKLRRLYADQLHPTQPREAREDHKQQPQRHDDSHQDHHRHNRHLRNYHRHHRHHYNRSRYRSQVRRRRGTTSRTRADDSTSRIHIPRERVQPSVKARAILHSSKRVFHHHHHHHHHHHNHHNHNRVADGKFHTISSDTIKRKIAGLKNRYSWQTSETSGESEDFWQASTFRRRRRKQDYPHDYRVRQKSRLLFGRRRKNHGLSRSCSALDVADCDDRPWYSSHRLRLGSAA